MESTLAIARDELRAAVGDYLGYRRGTVYGDTAWTATQTKNIDAVVTGGLHQFYFPPPLPGEKVSHEWSFLKPTATLVLASGASAIALPDDFGGINGEVVIATPTGKRWASVPVVGLPEIDRLLSVDATSTSSPRCVAMRPLRGVGRDRGQRMELAVYPAADQEYGLKVGYTLVPEALTAANPYPYGGAIHRETMIQSCLAVAALRYDGMGSPEAMAQDKAFMLKLAGSVSHDRKFRPQMLGYNGNGPRDDLGAYRFDSTLATVAGLYTPAP